MEFKTYYIYHIPGVKIGCTINIDKRIGAQGYTEYEILETHNDKNIAGNRERELQIQYGYKVDKFNYADHYSDEYISKISKLHSNKPKSDEHKLKISMRHKNKVVSEETKLKISLAYRKRLALKNGK